jgi:hypothetical protein
VNLSDVTFDNRPALFTQHYDIVQPPEITVKHPKMRINLLPRNKADDTYRLR